MANFEELSTLLGGLKGVRANVVLAMALAGRPLSQGELQQLTGYSVKPVRHAIRALLAQGIVYHDGPRVLALSADWFRAAAESAADTAGSIPFEERPAPAAESAADTVESAPLEEQPATTAETAADPPKSAVAHDDPGFGSQTSRALLTHDSAESAAIATAPGAETTQASQIDAISGQIGLRNDLLGPFDQQDVVVVDPILDQLDDQQQQQQIPQDAAHLAAVLRRMGVTGRAFWRLAAREDLAARPEVVLAWWWYYRAQEGLRNPVGAAISRLYARNEPPEGYLALARLWPQLSDELRQELESMVLYNWSAEQIAARLRPECPGLTAGAVVAFMALSLEELEG